MYLEIFISNSKTYVVPLTKKLAFTKCLEYFTYFVTLEARIIKKLPHYR